MEKYTDRDFRSIDNQPIIIEVRDQRLQIVDLNERIKDIDGLLKELNTKLVLQDMTNAIKLLQRKANKLRERL